MGDCTRYKLSQIYINLLDACLHIQKPGKHVYQKSIFCVTPIVPESLMIVSSINVLV